MLAAEASKHGVPCRGLIGILVNPDLNERAAEMHRSIDYFMNARHRLAVLELCFTPFLVSEHVGYADSTMSRTRCQRSSKTCGLPLNLQQ